MYKITCSSYDCTHNMAGGCDAGVVNVREHTGRGAYCDTYTLYSDDENATYDISPLGFKCYRRQGSIVCSMLSCAYLKDGLCSTPGVLMEVPSPGEDVFCMTYTKEAHHEDSWT